MKTYEKHLLTEAKTLQKKIELLKKKIKDISTPIELRMAMSALSEFMKKNTYTDELRDELLSLVDMAKKKI